MTNQDALPTPGRAHVERYDPTTIEPRWQQRWEQLGLYRTDLHDTSRPRFYLLTMYPYPSGDLHIGHWYIKTPTDAIARYHRMHGENVFLPVGFDAFGLPAENAAIKNNINPRAWTMSNIENMRRQLRSMGASFDWEAEVVTSDPQYYRWNQWFFLKFLEAGLAYRKTSPVDWCPNDGTLAREQVEGADRHCWRCGAKVEKRDLAQWYLRVTKYADELLDFSSIDFPEPIRVMQTNWIGRSEGAEIVFETAASDHHGGGAELRVFTTRPDTLFGATFMVLAPEHPLVTELTAPDRRADVDAYVAQAATRTEIDRLSTDREKTGVAIGADAINPVNGERIPIFVADYVLGGYGTGAIMAVPAHDERDYAFAVKHGLPIRRVVAAPGDEDRDMADGAYVAHATGRAGRQQRHLQRPASERRRRRHRHGSRDRGQGQDHRHLPPPRLADQPAALLGDADPGHLLPGRRHRAGARGRAARPPAGHGRLPRQRREPPEPRRVLPERRRARSVGGRLAVRPTPWTRSSIRRGTGIATCHPRNPVDRSTSRSSSAGRRSTSTRAAPSTR